MKICNFVRPENGLTQDPLYFLNFEKYEKKGKDCYFFMADFYAALKEQRFSDKPKIALTLEEPNFCLAGGHHVDLHSMVDTILTLCPYSAECLEKRTFVFFPFSEDWIPFLDREKTIDVSYFGSMPVAIPWRSYLQNVLMKYNYVYGNYSEGNAKNITYAGKIKALSMSKVAVVHGLCNVDPRNVELYKAFPNATKNKAFMHLEKGLMPQIKSRMFEAAFCKALILCQKDYWNPIENFFTPDKEFIYFSDEKELSNILDHVINNYAEYDTIRLCAYDRAIQNYTTKHFVDKFLS
jgi:hypothetical protein